MMKKIFVISLLCSACYLSEEIPPDQQIWEYDLPKNQRLDQELLLNINNRILIQDEAYGTVEGLTIVKNNRLVFENYYSGELSRSTTKSIGKLGLSITLAALGVAIDQRFISVEDSIHTYLPEYSSIFQADPTKRNIKVKDVLTHRTGLAWNEIRFTDNDYEIMKSEDDWLRYFLTKTLFGVGIYNRNTANGILIARIIQNATGRDFNDYVQEELFAPLAIDHPPLEQDASGNYNGGDGYQLSMLDFTKISYLFLQEGFWEGRTLINSNLVKDALSRQHQFSTSFFRNTTGYFWSFMDSNAQNSSGLDLRDVTYFVGETGQSIYLVPEENMIITFHSSNFFSPTSQSINLFFDITNSISQ